MTSGVLEARVRGVNRAHQYAMELYPRLAVVFQPFVGQKVETNSGPLMAKVQKLVDALNLPCTGPLHVYRDQSDYCMRYVVKTCECENGHGYYYNASVTVGELDRGVLTALCPAPQYRTDYSADEVAAARQRYKNAKRAADEAHSALYPFGESDY